MSAGVGAAKATTAPRGRPLKGLTAGVVQPTTPNIHAENTVSLAVRPDHGHGHGHGHGNGSGSQHGRNIDPELLERLASLAL